MNELVLAELSRILSTPVHSVSLDSSFTRLGGHSLSALALVAACKRHGIHLTVEAILTSGSIQELLDTCQDAPRIQIQCLEPSEEPATIINYKLPETIPAPMYPEPDPLSEISKAYPATEMQLSLIHGSEKKPGTNLISYHETYHWEDVPTMKRAWNAVVVAEPIFRTRFDLQGYQIVETAAPFIWQESVKYSGEDDDYEIGKECLETQIGSWFRVITRDRGPRQQSLSTIIWTIHHALIDGYSASLILQKVRRAAAGLPIQPGPSFGPMAEELLRLRDSSRTMGQKFWRERITQFPSAAGDLLLPPPLAQSSEGLTSAVTFTLDFGLDILSQHARKCRITVASIFYAAWALALSLYADSDTVVYGAVLSGRNLPLVGIESTVGPLFNTLPLHVAINRSQNTTDYLRHIFIEMLALARFQWTIPEDGYTRQFSSALAIQFDVQASKSDAVAQIAKSFTKTSTDIPLSVLIEADGTIQLLYHSDIFRKRDIEMLGLNYHNSLLALCSSHHTVGMCLDGLMSCEVQQDLRRKGNCISGLTTRASVRDDLVSLFGRAVADHPDDVAVEQGDKSLTYQELASAASRVARHLEQFIGLGDVVCMHSDRSINWIVGMYGILKCGGVYCSLDPLLPSNLRDSMYQAANSKLFLILTASDLVLKPSSCTSCLAVEDLLSRPELQSPEKERRVSLRPWANAYLCFTSGSTGKPKGVMCSHEGLVAFQRDLQVRLFAQPGVKVAQLMSVAFDGSIHEIFSALSYGATLVLQSSADPFAHLHLVDSAILTPSIAQILDPKDFPNLKYVYLVGEPVPQAVCDRWGVDKELYNMYGPTEGTCGATIKRLLPGCPISIGAPNPSTRIYILDSRQSLVPMGVIGEIYIAGVQVARGYIGLPEEIKARFLPDPVCQELCESMYRTGDQGYWNEAGEVVCLGRNDRQIKLRGFCLDLNDIEIRIAKAVPTVIAVAVFCKHDHLVAHVQPGSLDSIKVKCEIAKVLPVHAVPRLVFAVDSFPRTKAGKLDYTAIAKDEIVESVAVPRGLNSSSEKKVARVWRQILQLDNKVSLDANSNFADLGGHSLLQILLCNRLATVFERRITLRLVIESSTLHYLAKSIDELRKTQPKNPLQGLAMGDCDLTPIEKEWWQKYDLDESSSAFNVSFACSFSGAVDRSMLTRAWNVVLSRHRILSCRYVARRRNVKRVYSDSPPKAQRVSNLNVWTEINTPFQLAQSDPVRVFISKDQMVVTLSHIICDLTTLQLLLQEVAEAYKGSQARPARKTYTESTLWGRIATACDLDFWSNYLRNVPVTPYFLENGKERNGYRGSSLVQVFPSDLYHRILHFSNVSKVTLHQIALAAVALCLHVDREDTDIVLGSPFINRMSDDDLDTIRLFLEPMPIRIRYDQIPVTGQDIHHESLLQSVQKSSQAALAHVVPWDQLLEHLAIVPDFPTHPLFDTVVTVHDERKSSVKQFPINGVDPLYTWTEGSKFKLMCEFLVLPANKLVLRLEYDTNCFSHSSISRLQMLIGEAIDCLITDVPYVDMKARLRKVA